MYPRPPADPHLSAPLARFNGERPAAPAWFDQAIADAPQHGVLTLDGGDIETLTWGERGKPGLLLMHGNSAHAHWWSFIAPFFAADFRVVAYSFSGAGGSAWRERYSKEGFALEALAVAEHTGLFDGPCKPIFLAHSFGGLSLLHLAATRGDRLQAAVVVDTVLHANPDLPALQQGKPTRLYPTLQAALARFRLSPPQPCDELYLLDHIARHSIHEQTRVDEGHGYTWRFDPAFMKKFEGLLDVQGLDSLGCPLAVIWGDRSTLFSGDTARYTLSRLPVDTPRIVVPQAGHHVFIDQPLAFVSAVRGLLAGWPRQA